jgi:hypothetical protein
LFRNLQQHSRTTWQWSTLFRNKRNDQYCFAKQITVIHIVPEQYGSDLYCSEHATMIHIILEQHGSGPHCSGTYNVLFCMFRNNMNHCCMFRNNIDQFHVVLE